MNEDLDAVLLQREKDLIRLARALYESAVHEEDKERLELHRQLALKLSSLIDKATNEDGILPDDLSLNLLLFIELKKDGSSAAEPYRKYALEDLEANEADQRTSDLDS